ncbi:hypothetical protein [Nitrospirillum bahiense]|uniref:Uncharacterized protein n=1 Tax=Nitrospirillum amazonense TaxID=28077 RepID=A0A560G1B1_9PROT|nr:hypothetical protein [Nitrospirillum amazonense]TWB27686.1 hypothetical protein FBZ88_106149 [Nitrospirillum amazonense]
MKNRTLPAPLLTKGHGQFYNLGGNLLSEILHSNYAPIVLGAAITVGSIIALKKFLKKEELIVKMWYAFSIMLYSVLFLLFVAKWTGGLSSKGEPNNQISRIAMETIDVLMDFRTELLIVFGIFIIYYLSQITTKLISKIFGVEFNLIVSRLFIFFLTWIIAKGLVSLSAAAAAVYIFLFFVEPVGENIIILSASSISIGAAFLIICAYYVFEHLFLKNMKDPIDELMDNAIEATALKILEKTKNLPSK